MVLGDRDAWEYATSHTHIVAGAIRFIVDKLIAEEARIRLGRKFF